MTTLGFVAIATASGLGMYYGIGGLYEWLYYRRRRDRPETWKCQPDRFAPRWLRKSELIMGSLNMTAGSIASGLLAAYVAHGGKSGITFAVAPRGLGFAVASTLFYFLATDCGLYWAHRIFHRPRLFRLIHRWHHRNTAPTAFTAPAMHPIEFATYQSVMLLPLFVLPVHVIGVIASLLYQNYVALLDHSGIDFHSFLPWQPPTRFHDDHHACFHVNYGQNLGLWDRLFGTYRREDRRYGADVFGGRGAPLGADSSPRPRLVDYRRRARGSA